MDKHFPRGYSVFRWDPAAATGERTSARANVLFWWFVFVAESETKHPNSHTSSKGGQISVDLEPIPLQGEDCRINMKRFLLLSIRTAHNHNSSDVMVLKYLNT